MIKGGQVNYKKIYESFILDRLSKEDELDGYFERHHIVPRSLGGGDDKCNIIKLTPSDHFFAHSLLAKIYGGPMYFSLSIMAERNSSSARGYKPSRVKYDSCKKHMAEEQRKRMTGSGNSFYGRKHSEETRKKISLNRRGKCKGASHHFYGKKMSREHIMVSEDTKKKISRSKLGSKNPMYGKTGEFSPSYKTNVFLFHNKDLSLSFEGTQHEFTSEFNLDFRNVSALVLGKRKSHKKWNLIGCVL